MFHAFVKRRTRQEHGRISQVSETNRPHQVMLQNMTPDVRIVAGHGSGIIISQCAPTSSIVNGARRGSGDTPARHAGM